MEAETWGAFLMTFLLVELAGRQERGEIDDGAARAPPAVTPLTKLVTGKQAVAVVSEAIESFGGAGYVEDTGLPGLLRDTQVLPIWEGTTNVLSLDALLRSDLHARARRADGPGVQLRALAQGAAARGGGTRRGGRASSARRCGSSPDRTARCCRPGARRLAMTLARSLQLVLLCEHAQWMMDRHGDRRGYAAAMRYSRLPVDLMHEVDPALDRALLQ